MLKSSSYWSSSFLLTLAMALSIKPVMCLLLLVSFMRKAAWCFADDWWEDKLSLLSTILAIKIPRSLVSNIRIFSADMAIFAWDLCLFTFWGCLLPEPCSLFYCQILDICPLSRLKPDWASTGVRFYLYTFWTHISTCICYQDVNWLIPKISVCRARIWTCWRVSKANESQTSYSIEQADIFQNRSYSHSDDMFIILKSNKNTDIWYIRFDICIFAGKNHMNPKYSSISSL